MVKEFQKKKGKSLSEEKKFSFFQMKKFSHFHKMFFFVKNAINAEKQTSFLFKNLILPNYFFRVTCSLWYEFANSCLLQFWVHSKKISSLSKNLPLTISKKWPSTENFLQAIDGSQQNVIWPKLSVTQVFVKTPTQIMKLLDFRQLSLFHKMKMFFNKTIDKNYNSFFVKRVIHLLRKG